MTDLKSNDSGLFGEALGRQASDSYLGSYAVLQSILRAEIADFMQTADDENPAATAAKGRQIAQHLTKILLGKDEVYAGVPGWNEPGAIDRYLAPLIGTVEEDPERVLEQWAIGFLTMVAQLANFAAQPGVLDQQWKGELSAIIDDNARLLMGIDPSLDEMVDGDLEVVTAQAMRESEQTDKAAKLYLDLKERFKEN